MRPETNRRRRLERTIIEADATAWPERFQNLRSSRQTERSADYPITDVRAWMRNTPDAAADHRSQRLADSFLRAARGGADCARLGTTAADGIDASHYGRRR